MTAAMSTGASSARARHARARHGRVLLVLLAVVAGVAGCNRGGSGAPGAPGAQAATMPGKALYERTCFSCHSTGAAGAPHIGDAAAWAPRVAKGRAALMSAVVHGVPPGMPAKGLCPTCSDQELGEALDYLLAQSR